MVSTLGAAPHRAGCCSAPPQADSVQLPPGCWSWPRVAARAVSCRAPGFVMRRPVRRTPRRQDVLQWRARRRQPPRAQRQQSNDVAVAGEQVRCAGRGGEGRGRTHGPAAGPPASHTASRRRCPRGGIESRTRCAAGQDASSGARRPQPPHCPSAPAARRAEVEVPVALEVCWALWDDRERIPQWMPWIKSVKVEEADTRLSRWTLATHQFGRCARGRVQGRRAAGCGGTSARGVRRPARAHRTPRPPAPTRPPSATGSSAGWRATWRR